MSTPKLGDASIGVRITADGTDLLQTFTLMGPTLINAGVGGLMNSNADDLATFVQAQVNAYRTATTQ